MNYVDDMIKAMVNELHYRKSQFGHIAFNTIYFGGGTPSVLNPSHLAALLDAIYQLYRVDTAPEVTLEANPDDIDKYLLASIEALGVNRLSIGIQSFNDSVLKYFNRVHDASQAIASVLLAQEAGITNINADLIYGLPTIDGYNLTDDLEKMLSLQPKHISAYALTIEQGTVFGNWLNKGKIKPLDDDKQAGEFLNIFHTLSSAGYEQYEISNYSLPGYYSRHNSSYWQGEPYMGIGPGAHGFDGKVRYANVRSNPRYLKGLEQPHDAAFYQAEELNHYDRVNEMIMVSLRMAAGLDMRKLQMLLSEQDYALLDGKIHNYMQQNLMQWQQDHRVTLTLQGKLLADRIAMELFFA